MDYNGPTSRHPLVRQDSGNLTLKNNVDNNNNDNINNDNYNVFRYYNL